MAGAIRKPIFDRMTALVAGPFPLGRRALGFEWLHSEIKPPEQAAETPARITITSPEHAIKRRG
jgi:hypothetical protein